MRATLPTCRQSVRHSVNLAALLAPNASAAETAWSPEGRQFLRRRTQKVPRLEPAVPDAHKAANQRPTSSKSASASKRKRPQPLDSEAVLLPPAIPVGNRLSDSHSSTDAKDAETSFNRSLLTFSKDMIRCATPPAWSPPSCESENESVQCLRLPSEVPPIPLSPAKSLKLPLSSPSQASSSNVALVLNKILPLSDSPRAKPCSKLRSMSKQLGLASKFFKKEQPPGTSKPLLSLVELRRQLLKKWDSLKEAFAALEHHLDKQERSDHAGSKSLQQQLLRISHKKLTLNEFIQACAFFALPAEQAQHLFRLMDANGDGDLTIGEFRKALTDMPRHVLLQDFRQRLLTKYPSIPDAFKELGANCLDENGRARPLDRAAFTSRLLHWGVAEEEAQALFLLIDEDKSGSISLDELRQALREVAPWVSLDEFNRRFAHQWPDIAQFAGRGAKDRRKGSQKLFAILSHHTFATSYPASSKSSSHSHKAPWHIATRELPDHLTRDAFAEICSHLDIRESNSFELFALCATAAKWQCRRSIADEDDSVCSLDDFFDCLHLWSENPLNKSVEVTAIDRRRDTASDVARHLAPVRKSLLALKGQLGSFKP